MCGLDAAGIEQAVLKRFGQPSWRWCGRRSTIEPPDTGPATRPDESPRHHSVAGARAAHPDAWRRDGFSQRTMNNLTDALHIPDTQSARDERHLAIQRVGVKDLRYPLQLLLGGRCELAEPVRPPGTST